MGSVKSIGSGLTSPEEATRWRLTLLETEVLILKGAVADNHRLSSTWTGHSKPFRVGSLSVGLAGIGEMLLWVIQTVPSDVVAPRTSVVTADTCRLLHLAEETTIPILALATLLGVDSSPSLRSLCSALHEIIRAAGVITGALGDAHKACRERVGPSEPVHGSPSFAYSACTMTTTYNFVAFLEGLNLRVHKYLSRYSRYAEARVHTLTPPV